MIPSRVTFLRFRAVPKDVRSRNIALTAAWRSEDESDKNKKNKAKHKMNELLLSIVKESRLAKEEIQASEISKSSKFKKIKPKPKTKELGEKLTVAAKEVVKTMKEDPEKAEADILHKLLYKNEKLQQSVLRAAGNKTLSELLSGMKVETDPKVTGTNLPKESEFSRAVQVRNVLGGRNLRPYKKISINSKRINVFGAEPLNWFKVNEENKDMTVMSTWDHCKSRELKLNAIHAPSNYWEQMILWTDRGILWKFPIDNEQGMTEEKKVSFEDHVFLENHLEGWCPETGPIKNFMELVCVGLSQNHWLTAEEKKAHIMWYRDYFIDKKALIHELGAGEVLDTYQEKDVTS